MANRCHVVIGGGSAGVLLCQQLLEHGDDVILIERGSKDPLSKRVALLLPSQWPAAAFALAEATHNCTLPQSRLGMRQIKYPQGSGIGGTTNINAMIWSGGHPAVFDNYWPKIWNSKTMSRFKVRWISRMKVTIADIFNRNLCILSLFDSFLPLPLPVKAHLTHSLPPVVCIHHIRSFGSLWKTVQSVIKPRVNHSPLLEHLFVNRKLSDQTSCLTPKVKQVGSGLDHQKSADNSALIWDLDPVKSTYLSTIDSTTNLRIDMKDILYRYQDKNVTNAIISEDPGQIEDNKKLNNDQPSCGKLTILEYSTVVSIEFENYIVIDKNLNQISDIHIADKKAARTDSGWNTDEEMLNAKLTAVGVRYVTRLYGKGNGCKNKDEEKEFKMIRPSGGGEIILCAGVFESPRILISSGLGVKNVPQQSAESAVKKAVDVSINPSTDLSTKKKGVKGDPSDSSALDFVNSTFSICRPEEEATKKKVEFRKARADESKRSPFTPSLSGAGENPPQLLVTLKGIGRNLQDHTLLPIMCVGKWWTAFAPKDSKIKSIKENILRNIRLAKSQQSGIADAECSRNGEGEVPEGDDFNFTMSRKTLISR